MQLSLDTSSNSKNEGLKGEIRLGNKLGTHGSPSRLGEGLQREGVCLLNSL